MRSMDTINVSQSQRVQCEMGQMLRLASLFACLLTFRPHTASAQDRAFTGVWSLKADAVEGQTEDGGTWTRGAIKGALEIEQHDGTLTGAWKGPMGAAWPFKGTVHGDAFEILTEARSLPGDKRWQPDDGRCSVDISRIKDRRYDDGHDDPRSRR